MILQRSVGMKVALDIRPRLIHMVFMVCEPVPLVLEGCTFTHPVDPVVIVEALRSRESFYGTGLETIAACAQDHWPDNLEDILGRQGYGIHWVDCQALDYTVKTWQSLSPDPRWTRGGIMASLSALPGLTSCSGDTLYGAALLWLYASLREQLREMEGALFAEGISFCPYHLAPTCPLCARGSAYPGSRFHQ
jgi:hypothetical protein